jgi:CHAT domain-containing protein
MASSVSAFAAAARANARRGDVGEPLIFDGAATQRTSLVASAYRSSQVRTGAEATRERFFVDAAGRRVVHVAAKTSTNASYPLLSSLFVTDDPGANHSGAILGRDIAQRPLGQTGLVVIDEAEDSASNRGGGTLSLARAFMAAGVPAVLGTLPGADENAARDLMIAFHREISNGISAEQALSTVQRNVIQQNGRRLGAWTALVLYGSDR